MGELTTVEPELMVISPEVVKLSAELLGMTLGRRGELRVSPSPGGWPGWWERFYGRLSGWGAFREMCADALTGLEEHDIPVRHTLFVLLRAREELEATSLPPHLANLGRELGELSPPDLAARRAEYLLVVDDDEEPASLRLWAWMVLAAIDAMSERGIDPLTTLAALVDVAAGRASAFRDARRPVFRSRGARQMGMSRSRRRGGRT
jgi:hypothetical protein